MRQNSLATPVRILLPPIQLIVHAQRDTLLETTSRISCPSNDIVLHHQPQRHVKIFRYIALRPDLLLAIHSINKSNVLNRTPAQESAEQSISSLAFLKERKRRTNALWPTKGATSPLAHAAKSKLHVNKKQDRRHTNRYAFIDPPREIRNPILKVMMCDLHHVFKRKRKKTSTINQHSMPQKHSRKPTRLMLNDRHLGRLGHLPRRVPQTILPNVNQLISNFTE